MPEYQFKTSINCANCVKLVTMYMEEVPQLSHWQVDTANPDKILTVTGDGLEAEAVIEKVKEAGFSIEAI